MCKPKVTEIKRMRLPKKKASQVGDFLCPEPLSDRYMQAHPFEGEVALINDCCEDYFKVKSRRERIRILSLIGLVAKYLKV